MTADKRKTDAKFGFTHQLGGYAMLLLLQFQRQRSRAEDKTIATRFELASAALLGGQTVCAGDAQAVHLWHTNKAFAQRPLEQRLGERQDRLIACVQVATGQVGIVISMQFVTIQPPVFEILSKSNTNCKQKSNKIILRELFVDLFQFRISAKTVTGR